MTYKTFNSSGSDNNIDTVLHDLPELKTLEEFTPGNVSLSPPQQQMTYPYIRRFSPTIPPQSQQPSSYPHYKRQDESPRYNSREQYNHRGDSPRHYHKQQTREHYYDQNYLPREHGQNYLPREHDHRLHRQHVKESYQMNENRQVNPNNSQQYYHQPQYTAAAANEPTTKPSCLDVSMHHADCPVCSKIYKCDKAVYLVIIAILTIVCILLMKKVLNI